MNKGNIIINFPHLLSSSPMTAEKQQIIKRTKNRTLRDAGVSYEDIGKRLRAERVSLRGSSPSPPDGHTGDDAEHYSTTSPTSSTTSTTSVPWVTRKYVVRDLRFWGAKSVRQIRVECARRNLNKTREQAREDEEAGVGDRSRELRGVAGLAAYRACLGEVAIGPWRKEMPGMFVAVKRLRVVEVEFGTAKVDDEEKLARFGGEGVGGRGCDDPSTGMVKVVDFSLEWEVAAAAAADGGDYEVICVMIREDERDGKCLGISYDTNMVSLSRGGGGRGGSLGRH